MPGDEGMVETAAPTAPPQQPQNRLYDIEVVGGPTANGAGNEEPEEKRGFFKRLRGKKKVENTPETNDASLAE